MERFPEAYEIASDEATSKVAKNAIAGMSRSGAEYLALVLTESLGLTLVSDPTENAPEGPEPWWTHNDEAGAVAR